MFDDDPHLLLKNYIQYATPKGNLNHNEQTKA